MTNRASKQPFPFVIILGGIFLLAAAILLGVQNNSNPSAANQQADSESIPFPEISRVSLEDAKAAFDAGTAVFLDVRDAISFASSHIPGALYISLAELPERLDELNPDDWIIPYCT